MSLVPTTNHILYADHNRCDGRALATGFAKTMVNHVDGVTQSLEGGSDSLFHWSGGARATDYASREGRLVLILE